MSENFLLGKGELLTRRIEHAPKKPPQTKYPYSFSAQKLRLAAMINETTENFVDLPDAACPNNDAVALLTLHPQFISKSAYPKHLLRELGLRHIGSRSTRVRPEKWSRKKIPENDSPCTELFIAVNRQKFGALSNYLSDLSENQDGNLIDDFLKIESIRAISTQDVLKRYPTDKESIALEVILHAGEGDGDYYIRQGFLRYLNNLGIEPTSSAEFFVNGLWFLPIRAPKDVIEKLSKFSFTRAVRPMPTLRKLEGITRAKARRVPWICPTSLPTDASIQMAIFDGGLPANHGLEAYVNYIDSPALAAPHDEYLQHGLAVTGAALFGAIQPSGELSKPICKIDHYRVLDEFSAASEEDDSLELYDALKIIENALSKNSYEFANFSVGPSLPIEDHDVHAWTSVIDNLLAKGGTLATVAVGNDGHTDWLSGNARVQVPADCINALGVGAANKQSKDWSRAEYSSIGPGRSPGLIKPDILAFGGDQIAGSPFLVCDTDGMLATTEGTSFAAPLALRMAASMQAHFGKSISPLAARALLIHSADKKGHDTREVGWGKIPETLAEIISTKDGVVRILYQGELSPGKLLRTPIPTPDEPLIGKVRISATFCFCCEVDPQDSGCYTRAGLNITFRPNDKKIKDGSLYPASSSFFKRHDFLTESELRSDAHKWESTMSMSQQKYGTSLSNPIFDVHYNAREMGGPASNLASNIPYALVISIECKGNRDLYNQVTTKYRSVLTQLQPKIEIPITT